jgi:hypothetical protein
MRLSSGCRQSSTNIIASQFRALLRDAHSVASAPLFLLRGCQSDRGCDQCIVAKRSACWRPAISPPSPCDQSAAAMLAIAASRAMLSASAWPLTNSGRQ